MFEAADTLAEYWERRAARYARQDDGLPAVCSFGMPRFYNRAIELCQRRALRPWLDSLRGRDVLEIGCGVGRWTQALAANGNRVTAIDLSPTMIAETRHRLERHGLTANLAVGDVSELDTGDRFDAALSVTVIQHVTDDAAFSAAFSRLASHLRPGARLILLEAAPSEADVRCDSPIFRARSQRVFVDSLTKNGFRVEQISGVDPMPFRTWILPHLRSMPRPLAIGAAMLATGASLPLDLLLADRLVRRSWHKVFVASRI